MANFQGSLRKALISLFPTIGLDVSKFHTASSIPPSLLSFFFSSSSPASVLPFLPALLALLSYVFNSSPLLPFLPPLSPLLRLSSSSSMLSCSLFCSSCSSYFYKILMLSQTDTGTIWTTGENSLTSMPARTASTRSFAQIGTA